MNSPSLFWLFCEAFLYIFSLTYMVHMCSMRVCLLTDDSKLQTVIITFVVFLFEQLQLLVKAALH